MAVVQLAGGDAAPAGPARRSNPCPTTTAVPDTAPAVEPLAAPHPWPPAFPLPRWWTPPTPRSAGLVLGVTRDGGFAQYSVAPAAQCFKLAPELPFEAGAMAEPLACCLHGIDAAGIRPGNTVCVIGGGAIGLLMVQLARLSGAAKIILSEPVELRRKAGLAVGADLAVDPLREDLAACVREAAGKSGADVVIECVGNTAAARSAFETAGFGATVLLFSVPSPTATVPLPLFDVYKKELAIRGSFINPDTHLRAVELLSAGRINVKPLITHTFGLGEMEQAIKMQMGGESIKVMVLPNGQ